MPAVPGASPPAGTGPSFTVDVNLTDGNTHDLELYFLDWDSTSRAEQVQISNAATGAVLNTETVTSFHSGEYLEWAVSGNLLITFTTTAGANAVLSGLFLDSTSAPAVTAETPASGATDVAVSSAATATFNEAVQASTISFTLRTRRGSPVAATVTYNSSNYTATLTPSAALAYNTTYTATVSGAQEQPARPWRHHSRGRSRRTPRAPRSRVKLRPAGPRMWPISTTATATFNEAVQSSTISFTLTPSGGSPVAATVTYNSSNYTATLTPSAALAYNTTYTATVSGAKDTAGDPMAAPFSWSFTTTKSAVPVAPSSMIDTVSNATQINLTWTEGSSGVTGFLVQRSTTNSNFTTVGTITSGSTTYYSDTGLTPSTTYYYQIVATSSAATPLPPASSPPLPQPLWSRAAWSPNGPWTMEMAPRPSTPPETVIPARSPAA